MTLASRAARRPPNEFTVASFNMERFFDTMNDPAISDVALTPTAFNNRLNKASLAIRNVLRTPDIIGVEEMENLTTLQAVAAKVNADAVAAGEPNPNYQAYLVEGNDIGGIDVGFLVKSSRVTVVDVTQFGKTRRTSTEQRDAGAAERSAAAGAARDHQFRDASRSRSRSSSTTCDRSPASTIRSTAAACAPSAARRPSTSRT